MKLLARKDYKKWFVAVGRLRISIQQQGTLDVRHITLFNRVSFATLRADTLWTDDDGNVLYFHVYPTDKIVYIGKWAFGIF